MIAALRRLRRKRQDGSRLPYPKVAEELNYMRLRTAAGKPFTGGNVQTLCFRHRICQD